MHASLLLDLVALLGGTVHTLEPEAEPALATVVIRDGRIEALLAPEVEPPTEARRIDVTGKHLVPGLIDSMVYFDPEHDALYVAEGVTTIRDLGGDPIRALMERYEKARDRVPGPTLLTPGAVIDGDPPSSSEAVILRTPAMADELLPILFNEEVDFLSVQLGLPADSFRRTLELAHERELQVWGPVPRAVSLKDALELGFDGILFLDRLLPEGVGWDFVQPAAFKKSIELVAGSGAGLVPLLHATALRVEDQGKQDFDLGLLDPLYESQWQGELSFRRSLDDDDYVVTGTRVATKQAALLVALREAGIPVLPGSGAPHPWLFPGRALHDELARWEAAGVPAIDVLAAATRQAAEELGIDDVRGTLAPGKAADLLVVGADPREGVAALRTPEIVVLRGHVLEREALDDLVATLRARLDAHRAELAKPIEVDPPELPEGAVVLQGKVDVVAVGQRIRAERYAVVREPDGALAYCGRTAYRTEEGELTRSMTVLQRTRDGKLDEFIVRLESGEDIVQSHGIFTADQTRIERRMNNLLVDTKRWRGRLATIDVGSVTSLLRLTQFVREEPFEVVSFHELLEPEVVQWVMGYGGEDELLHYVRTHKGATSFRSSELGSVAYATTVVGGGTVETQLTEEDALGGPGLPPPAVKLALLVPAEAGADAEGAENAETTPPAPEPAPDDAAGEDPADAGGGEPEDPADPGSEDGRG
ncbi:MAG: amidohydrolase family protein [Planctomycetota bacterium]